MRLCLHVLKYKEERDVPGFTNSSRDSKIITWKMRESISGEMPSQSEKCTDSQQFQMEARQWRNRNWQWSFGIDCHTDDQDESDEDEHSHSGVSHYTYNKYCTLTFYLHDQDHDKRTPPPRAQVARKRTSWWNHKLPLPSFLRNVRLEILVQFGNNFMLLKEIYRRQDIVCGDEAYFRFEPNICIPAEVFNRLMNTSKDQVQVTVYGVTKDVQQVESFGSVVAPLKSAGSKWEVFLGQKGTDVTIVASGGELIECHSNYISRNSPVLSKEFFPCRKQQSLVELLDLTRVQVEAFLRYQYNEKADMTLEAPAISLGVLKAAERFEIWGMWSDTIKTLLEKNSDWFEGSAAQELVDFLDKCSKRDEEVTQILIRKLSQASLNQRKEKASGIGYREETGENRKSGDNEEEWSARNLGTLLTEPKKSKCGELGKMLESQWTSLSLFKITLSEGYEDIKDDIIAALIVKDSEWFETDFALELMNFLESCDEICFQRHTWNLKKRLSLMLKEHSKRMEGTSGVAKQVVTNKAVKKYNSGNWYSSRYGNSKFQDLEWKEWTNDFHDEELAKMLESKSTSLSLLKVAQSYQNDELWNEIVTALLVKDSDWFEGESALELTSCLEKYSKLGDEATRTLMQKIAQEPRSQSVEEKSGNGEIEENYESNEHFEDLLHTGDNDAELGRQNLDAMKQRGIEHLVRMLDSKSNSVSLLEVAQGFQNDEMWNNVIEALLEKDCDWFEKDLALELLNLLRTCPKRNEEATQRLSVKLSQVLEQPLAIEEPGEVSEQAARSETTDQDKQNGHSRTIPPKRRKRKAVNQEQLPEFDSGNATAGGLSKSAAVNVKPRRSARLESVRRKTEGFGTEDESGKNSLQLSKQRKEFVWRTGKKFYGPRDIRKDPVLPKIAIISDPAVKVEKVEPLDEESEDSAGMHSAELRNHVAQEQDDVAAEEEMIHMKESSENNDDDGDYGVIKLDLEQDD